MQKFEMDIFKPLFKLNLERYQMQSNSNKDEDMIYYQNRLEKIKSENINLKFELMESSKKVRKYVI